MDTSAPLIEVPRVALRADEGRVSRAGRSIAWIAIFVLILYMTIGQGSGWYGLFAVDLRIVSLVSIALAFIVWGVVARRDRAWRPSSHLWPAILAVLVAFTISTATSWRPRISLEYLAFAVLLAGLYLLLVRLLASDFFRPRIYSLIALLLVVICVWYGWTVFGLWLRWWSLVGRVTVPPLRPALDGLAWGSPNTMAVIVVLFVAPVLAWFWNTSRLRRALLALVALLAATTVLLSGSRGAWLGVAGAGAVTVAVWLLIPENRRLIRATWQRGRTPRWMVGLAVGGVALGVAAAAPLVLGRLGSGGEQLRATLLATALRMFETAPVTGSGPGTWVVRRIAFTGPTEQDYYIPHAHNIYAQTLAEFGLLGVLAGLVLAIWLLSLISGALRDPDAVRRRFGWAGLFAIAYLSIHQLVDTFVGVPCVLFALALSIAYLDATARGPGSRRLALGRAPGREAATPAVALAAAIVIALGFSAWSESSAVLADRAVGAANERDWESALRGAREAEARDPDIPIYAFLVGLAALHMDDGALAAESLRRSTSTDGFPHAWLNLAVAEADRGETERARDALEEAMRVGRQQASVAFAAGTLYLRLEDEEAAKDAFAAALRAGPTLASDPFWQVTSRRSNLREAAIDVALLRVPDDDWTSALLFDRIDEAARRAGRLDEQGRRRAEQVIAAWRGDRAAEAALEEAVHASPMDLALVAWNARLARRAGDEATAKRYREWGDLIMPPTGAFGLDVRVTTSAGSVNLSGVDANVFGVFTYRRPAPIDLLAPGLPHLSLR